MVGREGGRGRAGEALEKHWGRIGEWERGYNSLPKTQTRAMDQDEKVKERNTRNSVKKLSGWEDFWGVREGLEKGWKGAQSHSPKDPNY